MAGMLRSFRLVNPFSNKVKGDRPRAKPNSAARKSPLEKVKGPFFVANVQRLVRPLPASGCEKGFLLISVKDMRMVGDSKVKVFPGNQSSLGTWFWRIDFDVI